MNELLKNVDELYKRAEGYFKTEDKLTELFNETVMFLAALVNMQKAIEEYQGYLEYNVDNQDVDE